MKIVENFDNIVYIFVYKCLKMSKNDNIKTTGVVLESLSNANFKVELENGIVIICHLSGKMRMNFVKVIAGDTVGVELSPYDLTKGRIYKRF